MLRAKRRRTRTHDLSGNPIFNTMNSTPLQSAYVNVNNNQKQLQNCRCTSCGNPNSGCLGCTNYYSKEEIEEMYHEYILNGAIDVVVENHVFKQVSQCKNDGKEFLNANLYSGIYKNIGKNIYFKKTNASSPYKVNLSFLYFQKFQILPNVFQGGGWAFVNYSAVNDATETLIMDQVLKNDFLQTTDWAVEGDIANCGYLYTYNEQGPGSDGGLAPRSNLRIMDITKNGSYWTDAAVQLRGPFCPQPPPPKINVTIDFDGIHENGYALCDRATQKQCNSSTFIRNPIPGYRKQLLFTGKLTNADKESFCPTINELRDHPKELPAQKRALTKNTVYKDNYAKVCGAFRKYDVTGIDEKGNLKYSKSKSEPEKTILCGYPQVKKQIQNRNGWMNDKYNYSSKQYLERRCRGFNNLAFNYLSNSSIRDSSNSEFLTGCSNARVYSNLPLKRGNKDCSGSKSQQIFVKFRFQPSLSTPTSQTSLYGYGNEINFPDNARLNPDNLKGNVIAILNLTQIVLPAEDKYGFEIMLTKALEKQFNEDTLKNFKFILNFNDINIQIPYSDLVRTTPGTFFDYEVYYDETKPNYHLIKKMINNGNIVGKNINVMMGKIESPIENCDLSCNNILGLDCTIMNCSQQMDESKNISCAKKGYTVCEATNNNCKAVYKRSNPRFSSQGGVSGGSRINRLKYQTQLKAQSTRKLVTGQNGINKTSAKNTNRGSMSFDNHVNSVNGFGGASNGSYPVSLYSNTYPTYKSNLSGACVGKSLTFNGLPQRCKMPDAKPTCRITQTLPQNCNLKCNTQYKCSNSTDLIPLPSFGPPPKIIAVPPIPALLNKNTDTVIPSIKSNCSPPLEYVPITIPVIPPIESFTQTCILDFGPYSNGNFPTSNAKLSHEGNEFEIEECSASGRYIKIEQENTIIYSQIYGDQLIFAKNKNNKWASYTKDSCFGIECSDTFETPVFLKAVNGAHVFIQQRDEGNKDIEDVNCWEFFHCEGDFPDHGIKFTNAGVKLK